MLPIPRTAPHLGPSDFGLSGHAVSPPTLPENKSNPILSWPLRVLISASPLLSNSRGQAAHTHVPLSPSNVNWYRTMGGDRHSSGEKINSSQGRRSTVTRVISDRPTKLTGTCKAVFLALQTSRAHWPPRLTHARWSQSSLSRVHSF